MSDSVTVNAPRQRRTFKNVTPQKTIEVWQSSDSVQQAADTLGLTRNLLLARINSYRKGILALGRPDTLKVMPQESRRKLNYGELAELANTSLKS